jgi:hypothetical protein
MREKCIGKECGNFNDPNSKFFNKQLKPGCKGGEHPPWSWAKWYIYELNVSKSKEINNENK